MPRNKFWQYWLQTKKEQDTKSSEELFFSFHVLLDKMVKAVKHQVATRPTSIDHKEQDFLANI